MYKCISLIVSSIFYLSSEFFSIITSDNKINSYYKNTISYLGTYDNNYYYIMDLALIINGIIYYFGFSGVIKKGLPVILSFFVGLGSVMVGLFHSGTRFMLLHLIGTCTVFITGNVNTIVISSYIDNKIIKTLLFSIGIFGLIAGLLIIILRNKTYLPILERSTVYPIVLSEIILPIYLLINYNNFTFI